VSPQVYLKLLVSLVASRRLVMVVSTLVSMVITSLTRVSCILLLLKLVLFLEILSRRKPDVMLLRSFMLALFLSAFHCDFSSKIFESHNLINGFIVYRWFTAFRFPIDYERLSYLNGFGHLFFRCQSEFIEEFADYLYPRILLSHNRQ